MKFLIALLGIFAFLPAFAEDLPPAIQNTRANCDGISEELQSLKNWAGANAAVTGVGTLAGGGAIYAGFRKLQRDKLAEEIIKKLKDIETMSDEEFLQLLGMMADYSAEAEREKLQNDLEEVERKSKNLGNWRTGLMAGNTATNIAGTAIAQRNKNAGKDIVEIVRACLDSIEKLKAARSDLTDAELARAQKIINECGKHDIKHLEKIPRRSEIAKWSAAVGIGTGASGTITSAVANTDKTREAGKQSEEGKQKEKNLNTASNVLAIASTAASGTATGFNAATIAAINNAMKTATDCEEALK